MTKIKNNLEHNKKSIILITNVKTILTKVKKSIL